MLRTQAVKLNSVGERRLAGVKGTRVFHQQVATDKPPDTVFLPLPPVPHPCLVMGLEHSAQKLVAKLFT